MKKFIAVFLLTFTLLFASGRGIHTTSHFFVPLADAFLHGRLYVDKMQFELHEMIPDEEVKTGIFTEPVDGESGKFYVIFPPLPAIILMPVVAIWGQQANQSLISMLIASLSVAVSFFVFIKITKDEAKSYWMTALYALGSMLWYHAVIGSGWYFSQVCALLFVWLAILASISKKNLFLIGTLVGLAYLCRFPAILSLPFFIYLSKDQWYQRRKINFKPLSSLLISAGIFVGISLLYNWVRYGHLGHYGYTLLELRPYNITNEYSKGSYSLSYIGRNLSAMFWSFPQISNSYPFLSINGISMALWFVCPAIAIAFFAPFKNRIVQASLLAIIFLLPATLLHGGVGASQFGYRYALDYLPFVFLLIAVAIEKKFLAWHKILIVLSIIVNFWGIWLSFLIS